MTTIFWILVGFAIGVFVPAPYDAIAKDLFGRGWNWIKSWWTDPSV